MSKAGLETKRQADAVVDAVFETITQARCQGEDVAITGFGAFKVRKRAAKVGVNPRTGEKVNIPAKTVPKFTAGKALKEAVA
mgnify:CR=1 FL=1